jgi:PAS domain S-box-containing protein
MTFKRHILRIIAILIPCLFWTSGLSSAQEKQVIRVGIRPYAPPIIYFVKSNGDIQYKGSQAEVLSLLESYINATFEYISSDDVTQRRTWLKEGRIDMIAGAGKEIDEDPAFRFISTGNKLEYRIYTNKDCDTEDCYYDFTNKRFVLISGVRYPKFLDGIPQNHKIVVNTDEEALRMLNKDLVDLFVTPSQLVSNYIIAKEHFKNIHPVGEVLGKVELGYVVRADDEKFYNRMSAAIRDLVVSGTIAYVERKHYQEAFDEIRREKNADRFLFIFSFFVLVILVGGVWSYLLRSRVQRITKELKTSEERLTNLIKFSPDMIFVLAPDGRIKQCNQSAELELGTRVDGFTEQQLSHFVVTDEQDRFSGFLLQALEGTKCTDEFHFKNEAGRILDVEVVGMLLPTTDPDIPNICCYARDMTKRNLLEHELIQADRLATIGQMAAAVAHEINNPLGIVQANVGLLMSHGVDEEERLDVIQTISRNVDRAGKITHDLLDVAKPRPPEMKVVDLVDLVAQTLNVVKLQLKGIQVQHDKVEDDSKVNGDPGLLEQVFINLFLNAKTAMQTSSEKRLSIYHEAHPDSDRLKVCISDTGKGISSERIGKVFDPFYTTNARSGFGLGLFLSHRIIENHGGTLAVSSTEGVGTDFVIDLPAIPKRQTP